MTATTARANARMIIVFDIFELFWKVKIIILITKTMVILCCVIYSIILRTVVNTRNNNMIKMMNKVKLKKYKILNYLIKL